MVDECACAQRTAEKVKSLDQIDGLKDDCLHVSSGVAVHALTVGIEEPAETEPQKMFESHCWSSKLAWQE